jgi:hypothetical protein
VRSSIVAHMVQIIAMQSDDLSRLPAARKALAPIDEVRAAQAAQGRRAEAPSADVAAPEVVDVEATVTPETPVPAVEEEEPAGNG